MDVLRVLEGLAQTETGDLPVRWLGDQRLRAAGSLADLISSIRRCDKKSDRLLSALVDCGPNDRLAAETILAALLRLRVGRCRGDQDRAGLLAGELAVVLAEAWRGELPSSPGRRLANVMADRAWGRVRAAERKGAWQRSQWLDCHVGDVGRCGSFESSLVEALALSELADRLDDHPEGALGRAWATVVEFSERPPASGAERNRYQYARRVLRRHVNGDLELVGLV